MKFSLFFIAEYANMVTASALMVTLFFGGWDVPFTGRDNIGPYSGWLTLLSMGIFLGKLLFFIFFFMWIRWTLPRFRYDQLMSLGWKIMLPLALSYIIIIAAVILILESAGMARGAMYSSIMGVVNVVLVMIVFTILDHGRIISPAYSRLEAARIARLRGMAARSSLASEALHP